MTPALAAVLTAALAACPQPSASPGYAARVDHALRSGSDVWGEALLRSRTGPTYAGARRYLRPLFLAGREKQRPLTRSGAHYVAFGPALHVADGSEILRRRWDGPRLTVRVGGESYGSCRSRLGGPRLAGGWLPILQTSYVTGSGARATQESFTEGGTSFLRVGGRGVRLGSRAFDGPTVYASWRGGRAAPIGREAYEQARRAVVERWTARVGARTPFVVPERRVLDAERALLVQNLQLLWRYSYGNGYEEFEFPEALDAGGVIGEYGFAEAERSIVSGSLRRPLTLYPFLDMGTELTAGGLYWRRFRDRAWLDAATPVLGGYVARLAAAFQPRLGLLPRERYSSDLPDRVYGLNDQAVVWQGLRLMSAAWAETGRPALARSSAQLADRLGRGLRAAVRRSERRLADGSLFVPVKLLDGERPYRAITASRAGSYWNLVMPYALGSGLFEPRSREWNGVWRYMQLHGSRLLGLVRAGAYALYGRREPFPVSGTDQVYGLNVSRLLADRHDAGHLVLSLYGHLAAGMTEGTFVQGEAGSVAPFPGESYRRMYLPPNGTGNAAFLENLRLTLIHELPRGLELAYATPRAWLAPGRRIAVREAPTAFGPLSYELEPGPSSVRVALRVPDRSPPRTLKLRLRLPHGRLTATTLGRLDPRTGTVDLSGLRGRLAFVVRYR